MLLLSQSNMLMFYSMVIALPQSTLIRHNLRLSNHVFSVICSTTLSNVSSFQDSQAFFEGDLADFVFQVSLY